MFKKAPITLALLATLFPSMAHAYIGPGAGFAFLGSSFVFILTIFLAILTISFWPIQWAWRKIRRRGITRKARTRRVVIVGLDGLEPKLVDKYIAEGKLPNLKQLANQGSYERLGTTLPALSPVAWSSFQTGVNPGAHNIFDFLTRDKRFCLPELASTQTEPAKLFKLGRFSIPIGSAQIRITRKSQPFWKILGKHGIFSTVLRVPISYPPEKTASNVLSAMCTPDLKGTQGTFTVFTTNLNAERSTGGEFKQVSIENGTIRAELEGPAHPKTGKALIAPLSFKIEESSKQIRLEVGEKQVVLKLNQFSEWLEVPFEYKRGKTISGLCRFCVRSLEPHINIYVSPINVNPEKPALPIAYPIYFATWLAKRIGNFGTLGLMEDTWARNEFALDDARFLDQTYLTHAEREAMFFEALERSPEGVVACVFDASDRIQHMFWRYLDDQHPAPQESEHFKNVIPEMYERMDQLVGRVGAKLRKDDVLIVMSDHGFSSFRRGINLNTWLLKAGYLTLRPGTKFGTDYLQGVDWEKTRAFAIGLSGLYLNREGRERYGIVPESEVETLKQEIAKKLEAIQDPKHSGECIRKVYDTSREYRGLYAEEAPDLIVGYAPGYRVSWESVTGGIEEQIFSDNTKAWSGDHHVDPTLVPGILFTNRKVQKAKPNIIDIAPTVLDLFAVRVPEYMEGAVIL